MKIWAIFINICYVVELTYRLVDYYVLLIYTNEAPPSCIIYLVNEPVCCEGNLALHVANVLWNCLESMYYMRVV